MSDHNPFLPEEDQNFPTGPEPSMIQGLGSILLGGGAGGDDVDTLQVTGIRERGLTIDVVRGGEFTPERDALLLEAYLSTSLPRETFQKLCDLLYMRYVAPYLAQKLSQTFTKEQPPVKRRRRRSKTDDTENS